LLKNHAGKQAAYQPREEYGKRMAGDSLRKKFEISGAVRPREKTLHSRQIPIAEKSCAKNIAKIGKSQRPSMHDEIKRRVRGDS
jgi:hypothetical protein